MSKKNILSVCSMGLILALALSAFVVPAFAQTTNPLAACDPSVQALVWAARDAYGYDVNTMMMSSDSDMTDDMDDEEMDDMDDEAMTPEPEATEAAKLLNTAKVRNVVQQAATVVDCNAIRTDVIAFIYTANGMTMGDMGMVAPTFDVDGVAITADFEVLLSGPQEVPGPGDDDGEGRAWVSVDADTNTVCWSMQVSGIELPAAAAHIHVGAEGESGGVVVPLSAPSLEGVAAGCTEAEAEVVQAILDNPSGYYVNIHTASFPAGAIRGQLLGL